MRGSNITERLSDSTQRIRAKIIQDAKEKARKIIEEAHQKAKKIISEAEAKAKENRDQAKLLTDQFYNGELGKHIAQARTENYQHIRAYESEIVDEVLEKASYEIKDYTTTPEYGELLRQLIIEAAVALEGGDLIVKVNERDRTLLKDEDLVTFADTAQKQTGVRTMLKLAEEPIRIEGGTVVTSYDGSATVDNSIEARLNRVREENRREIEALLFS